VSWAAGRIDVVVPGVGGGAWHTFYDRGWHGFDSLGGQLVDAAALSTWAPGRLDVFARGTDNNLYHQWYWGGWSGWQLALAGPIASGPAAASWAPGRVDLFATGTDQRIYHAFGTPPPPPVTFRPGTYRVGIDIPPGTYRTRTDSPGCYWARLSGFSGQLGDIIANNFTNFHDVVTISPSDAGFQTDGCSVWTSDLSAITLSPTNSFADGTWIVGTDVSPGTWVAAGGPSCYWARLGGFSGSLGDIIANNFGGGAQIVTIARGDAGFASDSCGAWTKVA
jgi:hypothetical protein